MLNDEHADSSYDNLPFMDREKAQVKINVFELVCDRVFWQNYRVRQMIKCCKLYISDASLRSEVGVSGRKTSFGT